MDILRLKPRNEEFISELRSTASSVPLLMCCPVNTLLHLVPDLHHTFPSSGKELLFNPKPRIGPFTFTKYSEYIPGVELIYNNI